MRITAIVGARPNFMKVAPILAAARHRPGVEFTLVHTGQHYDARMSDLFFEQLRLPKPDVHLGVGSGSHAVQTAGVMAAFDRVLDERPADAVLVVGDVNSTLACALVAAKRCVPVAHVEAGLRSGDRTMPEEVNRLLTDQISDWLFTTERSAADNLVREGIAASKIHFVGNVMIDSLFAHRGAAARTQALDRYGAAPRRYALCTLHRPSNVDEETAAARTVEALRQIAIRIPVVLPLHPRTRARWQAFGLDKTVSAMTHVTITEPLGYLEFLSLMDNARLVLTDSGGIQEETTALGVPCLTFRENTERPITVTAGTNRVVGTKPSAVAAAADEILDGPERLDRIPELWDGQSATRILNVMAVSTVDSVRSLAAV
jgi:UDP-N-acetylglucosamine 2-epimerase (non-hydrolysing)